MELPLLMMLQISILTSLTMFLLELLIYFRSRESIHKSAVLFWAAYISYFFYSFLSQGAPAIVVAGSTLFWIPRTFAIRRILEGLVARPLGRGTTDLWILGTFYGLGVVLYFLGEGFTIYTAPAALANFILGISYLSGYWKHSGRTVPHFFFGATILIVFLHILDYPVLRFEHQYTWVGFSVVLISTLFLAVTLPTLMAGQVIEEQRLHLEALVKERTDLSRLQGELFLRGKQLAGLSHEINNPLGIILGRAGQLKKMILRGELSQDVQKTALAQVKNSVTRIRHIVDAQASENSISRVSERRRIGLGEILEDVQLFTQDKIESKKVAFHVGTPAADLEVDPVQISQILVNLVNNAVDACGDLQSPRIDISAEIVKGALRISVLDNGPGVPAAIRHQLMSPFQTTKGEAGTGLGLYLSQKLAHRNGGTLRYDPLKGSARFILELPLAPEN